VCKDRWSTLRADLATLKAERAAAMADVPGGKTGLLVCQYQTAMALPVYRVDTGLISLYSQLLAIEKQAAEELGQWTEKREPAGGAAPLTSIKPWLVGPFPGAFLKVSANQCTFG